MQCFVSFTSITAMFFSDYFSFRKKCCLLFMSGRQDYCLHDYNIKYDARNACDNINVPLNYLLSLIFMQLGKEKKKTKTKNKENKENKIVSCKFLQPRIGLNLLRCQILSLQSNKGLRDMDNQYLTPGEYIKNGLNALD